MTKVKQMKASEAVDEQNKFLGVLGSQNVPVIATINHNEIAGVRVGLRIAHDDDGYYIETDSGEDTGPRFATPEQAEESIFGRWGNGWGLEYVEA